MLKMNIKQVLFVLSLVVLAAPGFETKERRVLKERRHELQNRQLILHRAGIQEINIKCNASCQDCVPSLLKSLGTLQVQGMSSSLTRFGPLVKKLNTLLGDVSNKLLGDIKDLVESVRLLLVAFSENFGPVTDELSLAIQKIFPCPRVPIYFTQLKNNLLDVIAVILKNYQPLLNAPDIGSVVIEIANIIETAKPSIVKIIMQTLQNAMELIGQCSLFRLIKVAINDVTLNPIIQNVANAVRNVGQSIKETNAANLSDLLKNLGSITVLPGNTTVSLPTSVKTVIELLISLVNTIINLLNGEGTIEGLIPAELKKLLESNPNIDFAGLTTFLKNLLKEISSGQGGELGNDIKSFLAIVLDILKKLKEELPK